MRKVFLFFARRKQKCPPQAAGGIMLVKKMVGTIAVVTPFKVSGIAAVVTAPVFPRIVVAKVFVTVGTVEDFKSIIRRIMTVAAEVDTFTAYGPAVHIQIESYPIGIRHLEVDTIQVPGSEKVKFKGVFGGGDANTVPVLHAIILNIAEFTVCFNHAGKVMSPERDSGA